MNSAVLPEPETPHEPAGPVNQRPAAAILLALLASLLFAAMQALVREVSGEIHPFQVAFVRSAVGVVFCAILVGGASGVTFRSRAPGLTLLRGVLGGVSVSLWFLGLSMVPLAEATALSFSSIIFASLGAVLLLGERMGPRRWTAVAIGFVGTLIILRPGADAVQLGALIVLASSVIAGISFCIIKVLVAYDPEQTMVFWTAVIMSLVTAVPALIVWTDPSYAAWLALAAIGCLGSLGMYAMARAVRLADASLVNTTGYTRLIWAVALGYLFFAELPDLWTVAGGGLIILSTLYIGLREAFLARGASLPGAREASAVPFPDDVQGTTASAVAPGQATAPREASRRSAPSTRRNKP